MSNSSDIILDLCGGTGAWSKPYVDAGYRVEVITLPHLPLFDAQVGDVREYEPPADVYGILAAPPCTMFSLARQTAKTPRDFRSGMEIVHACLQIVWKCRLNGKLAFWALENPKGYLRDFIGIAPFIYQHWEFGDAAMKPTEMWGKFNFPKKTVTERPAGLKNLRYVAAITGKDRKATRAITPPGFAKAFFEANK